MSFGPPRRVGGGLGAGVARPADGPDAVPE